MDISKAFSFQFEDKQWINKLGIGAVISIVPISNFALSGIHCCDPPQHNEQFRRDSPRLG